MELIDHPTLGFLQDNSEVTPPTQVSDLSSQGSYGSYEEAEDCLHLEMTRTVNRTKIPSSVDFQGNNNGLVQVSGSSLLSFRVKNDGVGNFMWRDRDDVRCFDRMESDFGSLLQGSMNNARAVRGSCNSGSWLYSEATAVVDAIRESDPVRERGVMMTQKRPYMGDSSQGSNKKQCTNVTSKSSSSSSKPKPASSSKDPQSVAAKNRRERISERLKILQDLVPNGNKVDLVTMLEKAISYVKFLQLQVKVLATDEFWPTQNGKAPDISQVKDAIDAILSSQRSDTSSSSK